MGHSANDLLLSRMSAERADQREFGAWATWGFARSPVGKKTYQTVQRVSKQRPKVNADRRDCEESM